MITTEQARVLFIYDNGQLYWKVKPTKRFMVGMTAGTVNRNGYVMVTIDGKKIHAHRVIWAWHGLEMPPMVDHINGIKTDNRIENLRASDYSTNACNSKVRTDNTSGTKGVSWCNTIQKWVVQVWKDNKKYGKAFHDFGEAKTYVAKLRSELHGDFAFDGVRQ